MVSGVAAGAGLIWGAGAVGGTVTADSAFGVDPFRLSAGVLGRGAKMTGSRLAGFSSRSPTTTGDAGPPAARTSEAALSSSLSSRLMPVRMRSPSIRAWPTPVSAVCSTLRGRSLAFSFNSRGWVTVLAMVRTMSVTDMPAP